MNQVSQPDSEPPAAPLEEQQAGGASKKPAPAKEKVMKAGAAKKTAQSAAQRAAQPAVQCIDSSVVVDDREKLISAALTSSPAKGSNSKRSSTSSRNESTLPSTKPVSRESQAGKRSNLGTQKSLECSATFSDRFSKKNATKSK